MESSCKSMYCAELHNACDAPTRIESDSFDIVKSVIFKHTRVALKKKTTM